MKRPRLTIGAALVAIAAFALAFTFLRPTSEDRAVEIAIEEFQKAVPGSTRSQIKLTYRGWEPRKNAWVIMMKYRTASMICTVGRMGSCKVSFFSRD